MRFFRDKMIRSATTPLSHSGTVAAPPPPRQPVWPLAVLGFGLLAVVSWIGFLAWALIRLALAMIG